MARERPAPAGFDACSSAPTRRGSTTSDAGDGCGVGEHEDSDEDCHLSAASRLARERAEAGIEEGGVAGLEELLLAALGDAFGAALRLATGKGDEVSEEGVEAAAAAAARRTHRRGGPREATGCAGEAPGEL